MNFLSNCGVDFRYRFLGSKLRFTETCAHCCPPDHTSSRPPQLSRGRQCPAPGTQALTDDPDLRNVRDRSTSIKSTVLW